MPKSIENHFALQSFLITAHPEEQFAYFGEATLLETSQNGIEIQDLTLQTALAMSSSGVLGNVQDYTSVILNEIKNMAVILPDSKEILVKSYAPRDLVQAASEMETRAFWDFVKNSAVSKPTLYAASEILDATLRNKRETDLTLRQRRNLTVLIVAYAKNANWDEVQYLIRRFELTTDEFILLTHSSLADGFENRLSYSMALANYATARLGAYDFLIRVACVGQFSAPEILILLKTIEARPAETDIALEEKKEKKVGLLYLLTSLLSEDEIYKLMQQHGLSNEDLREFREIEYYKDLFYTSSRT
jgi:hypothetical protein